MKNFEKNLEKLEEITEKIKSKDISLEEALTSFEEGIKLAKEIDRIEGKIQILMNQPAPDSSTIPELDLFSDANFETGSSGEPEKGTRQWV